MSRPATTAFLRFVSLSSLLVLGLTLVVSPVLAATYTVTITASQFVPATLSAAVGDTITFINSTTATQSAKSTVATGFNTGDIGPSQSKSVTLVNEGTFTYTSLYDAALTGVVTVGAGTSSLTDTSTTSATVTSQPTTTQQQPVSGTTETLAMLLASGLSLLGAGWYIRWKSQEETLTLINLPLVSSKHGANYPHSPNQPE